MAGPFRSLITTLAKACGNAGRLRWELDLATWDPAARSGPPAWSVEYHPASGASPIVVRGVTGEDGLMKLIHLVRTRAIS